MFAPPLHREFVLYSRSGSAPSPAAVAEPYTQPSCATSWYLVYVSASRIARTQRGNDSVDFRSTLFRSKVFGWVTCAQTGFKSMLESNEQSKRMDFIQKQMYGEERDMRCVSYPLARAYARDTCDDTVSRSPLECSNLTSCLASETPGGCVLELEITVFESRWHTANRQD